MQFRINLTLRTGESRVESDYVAHLERSNVALEAEVSRLKVASAETDSSDRS